MRQNKLAPYQVGGIYLVSRGGYFQIHGNWNNQRIRISTKTNHLADAKWVMDDFIREMENGGPVDGDDENMSWETVARAVCGRHRLSSRARGIPFLITEWDVHSAMKLAVYRCAISGIPFSRRIKPSGPPDPWGPSIDRIESRHGYIKDNIRVVCLAANLAMNRWGQDVLLRLAKAVVHNSTVAAHEPTYMAQISPMQTDDNRQALDIA